LNSWLKFILIAGKKGQKEGRDQEKILSSSFDRIDLLLKQIEKNLTDLLNPHLGVKKQAKLSLIFKELGNKNFLSAVTKSNASPERQAFVSTLVSAMEYYTHFHPQN